MNVAKRNCYTVKIRKQIAYVMQMLRVDKAVNETLKARTAVARKATIL